MQSHEERQSREIQRQRLSRVLWAFAVYHPRVRYCQGMNMVAALLLKVGLHTTDTQTQQTIRYMLSPPSLSGPGLPISFIFFASHVFLIVFPPPLACLTR